MSRAKPAMRLPSAVKATAWGIARKQLAPRCRFKSDDVLADGRLTEPKNLRSGCEAAGLGHRQKRLQQIDVKHDRHSWGNKCNYFFTSNRSATICPIATPNESSESGDFPRPGAAIRRKCLRIASSGAGIRKK
ncbi:MAG: hypothetical protein WDN69_30850 [Aliidongia sp.]